MRDRVQKDKDYQIYLLVNGKEVKGTETVRDLDQAGGRLQISVEHALPNPPENCKISPMFRELEKMTYVELKAVENFEIWNKHGRVVFLEPVDLIGVDLTQAIKIYPGVIYVYEDVQKPEPGTKLLKQAKLTIFNCRPGGQTFE